MLQKQKKAKSQPGWSFARLHKKPQIEQIFI